MTSPPLDARTSEQPHSAADRIVPRPLSPTPSNDERGARIAGHLEGEGISLVEGSVAPIGSPRSVATSTVDAAGEATYSFELAWDPPGAGDSFMAGLLFGLLDAGLLGGTQARERLRSASLADVRPAVERALACAAITLARRRQPAPAG